MAHTFGQIYNKFGDIFENVYSFDKKIQTYEFVMLFFIEYFMFFIAKN